mmetsp:Transcript_92706/g.170089  ORF Transcript_92706/g.170089 Transcript_92706/m.170089 type:complete len:320 (+) Transcript_92706:1-960(+)
MLFVVTTLPVSMGGYAWMMAKPEDERFFVPYLAMGVLSVFCLVAFNIRFCMVHDGRGVPKYPDMLPEDEMELVAVFGAMTLKEAAEIVGLDPDTLFKRLADPDPENLKQLVSMVNLSRVETQLAERSPEDMVRMLEVQADLAQDYEEEEEDEEEEVNYPPEDGFVEMKKISTEKEGDGKSSGELTAQSLATDLCSTFKEKDASLRKAMLDDQVGKTEDEMRWKALGYSLDILIFDGEQEACKAFLLEVPIEDQLKAIIGMEDWMDEKRRKESDKKFNKLIPAKVFAGLIKKRPELKNLVAQLVKREVKRSVRRSRGQKG